MPPPLSAIIHLLLEVEPPFHILSLNLAGCPIPSGYYSRGVLAGGMSGAAIGGIVIALVLSSHRVMRQIEYLVNLVATQIARLWKIVWAGFLKAPQ